MWMNASTCEYFMQLRMQQLEMIALELNSAFPQFPLSRAIKLPALSQVKVAWQCIFKIHPKIHSQTHVGCAVHTHTHTSNSVYEFLWLHAVATCASKCHSWLCGVALWLHVPPFVPATYLLLLLYLSLSVSLLFGGKKVTHITRAQ